MRLLLAGVLALLPLTALAETPRTFSAEEISYLSKIDPFSPENLGAAEIAINEPGLYRSPYSPTAVTNFEALAPQLPKDQAGKGESRLDAPLYQSHPQSHPQSLRHDQPARERRQPLSAVGPTNPYSQGGRTPRR